MNLETSMMEQILCIATVFLETVQNHNTELSVFCRFFVLSRCRTNSDKSRYRSRCQLLIKILRN